MLLFFLLFWYYLSSFCAVYKNTQGPLLIDTIEGIVLSLFIYPFIFGIILCSLKVGSLRAKNKIMKCLYKCSHRIFDFIL